MHRLQLDRKELLFLVFIFLLGFALRVWSVWPYNTIIGFDQARDLWDATTIFRDFNLRIIGPTAGNNPNLHHGVLFLYYLIPPLILFKGNPMGVVFWNSIFNAGAAIVLYFLAKDVFKSFKAGVIAAILASVSYLFVQYSGWISNPTVTIFTVPLFFYFLWKYHEGRKWGMPLAFLFMGLSIAFELFFIYLIPVGIILFLLLRMRRPALRIFLLSVGAFCITTLTMIATEFKFGFAGVKSILGAGQYVGGREQLGSLIGNFLQRWDGFYNNFSPQFHILGVLVAVVVVSFLFFELIWYRRDRLVFILIYLFSPAVMFLLGSHNAPWFMIGRPAAIILVFTFVLLKIKSKLLLSVILVFIIISNLFAIRDSRAQGQILLEPDKSAILADQVVAVDYTYNESRGQRFSINSVTNPLYINAVWSYNYYWYGKQLPTWAGGDQLYPYDVLKPLGGDEKYLYVLIDESARIPENYRLEAIDSADKISRLIETKRFGDISVQKRELW